MTCDFYCIARPLTKAFGRYGVYVSRHTVAFLFFPLLACLVIFLMGFFATPIHSIRDTVKLYSPSEGRAAHDLKKLESYYRMRDNDTTFPYRRYDLEWMGWVIVKRKNGGNILDDEGMREVMIMWSNVLDLALYKYHNHYDYSTLCIQLLEADTCTLNPLLLVFHHRFSYKNNLTYPLYKPPVDTVDEFFIGNMLGGVKLNGSQVLSAEAMVLPYQLKRDEPPYLELARLWELRLTDYLSDYQNDYIDVTWWTYETMVSESRREQKKLVIMMMPLFAIIVAFTFLTSLRRNHVRSKPWCALGGCVSAAIAVFTSVAFVLLCQFEFTSVVFFMPFIVFSIGVDDIYVLLSAWRRSPVKLSTEDRMQLTFEQAGMSITITSLTDFLSFSIGCITTFPAVWRFCLYAAAGTLFTYFMQMTFFAAIMAISGHREEKGRHAFTYKKVKESQLYEDTDKVVELKQDLELSEDDHMISRFFGGPYCTFLLMWPVRISAIIIYAAYISVAVWGLLTHSVIGLNPADIMPIDSYAVQTIDDQAKYFYEYQDYIHVWFDNLDQYEFKNELIEALYSEVGRFENTEFTATMEKSWLHAFDGFMLDYYNSILDIDFENETLTRTRRESDRRRHRSEDDPFDGLVDYASELSTYFLAEKRNEPFINDIIFSPGHNRIRSCRFLIRLRHFGYENHTRALDFFWHLADNPIKLDTNVYHDLFLYADQNNEIIPTMSINVGISAASVMLVSLLLIPNPVVSIYVCFTIVSIIVGMLGYGSLWSVRLDFAAMITTVMSIGFCVDFSAHIAYSYSAHQIDASAEERLRGALRSMGFPIAQSVISTVIGVSVIATIPNHVGYSFVKMIVMSVLFGGLHGLFFLPVVLTLLTCDKKRREDRSNVEMENIEKGATNYGAIIAD